MIVSTLLGLTLLLALPADALWRSFRPRPQRSRERRYLSTMARALALLAALGVVAQAQGIRAADLGLAWPPNRAGLIGFALGAAMIAGLLFANWLAKPKPRPRSAEQEKALANLPETSREVALFVILTPVIGFGWEVLYRGYLLWWMVPALGTIPAVLAASLAYGLAHGWQSWRQCIGSIVSALLFTSAYAITGSLWWLIFIHTALPLVGFLAALRVRASDQQVGAFAA